MSKRIDLTQFEGMEEWEVEKRPDGGYAIKTGRDNFSLEEAETIAKLPTLIDELKRCYERLDMANEAMLTAREVLMKHHEWMSVNDSTSEEDDQEILDVVKALREASLGMSVDKPKCRNCGATTNLHQNRFDKKHDCGACLQELRDMNDFDSQHSF